MAALYSTINDACSIQIMRPCPPGPMSTIQIITRSRSQTSRRCFTLSVAASAAKVSGSVGQQDGPPLPNLDLHKYRPQGHDWATKPSRWVVFSDLHVSPRTLPVCLDVLKRVHDEATKRDAGVIFLGDFWHLRGALPVEPLNCILKLFSSDWDVQTLMLVGNHDQATFGGFTHALTPIAAAAPSTVHVFDGPTLYADALWLPYRRDPRVLRAALDAAPSAPKAVFAHVDVAGASLNDAYQARDGLLPTFFPTNVPTYTGHYHKPHIVPGTKIKYIGSPYQVTRSEAGQDKALVVLDASDYAIIEEVPLDFGPRHFQLNLADAAISNSETKSQSIEGVHMRPGDRVRLIAGDMKASDEMSSVLKLLSSMGLSVELIATQATPTVARIPEAEDLNAVDLFSKYASLRKMSPSAVQRGKRLLSDLLSGAISPGASLPAPVLLSFKTVEVEGYFSFKDRVTYGLGDRGLVVITGRIEGSAESPSERLTLSEKIESNGAGKTALAMAPLWALTGDVDVRSDGGGGRGLTNAAVVNEGSTWARVRVEGSVDGLPFMVERKVVRRGRGGWLRFELGGEDRTGAEMRLTQAAIDEILGAKLLGRVAFYGQSDITALLESSDREFKDELAKIIDLAVWAEAKDASREALAATKSAAAECIKELQIRAQMLSNLEVDVQALRKEQDEAMQSAEALKQQSQQQAQVVSLRLMESRSHLQHLVGEVEAWLHSHGCDEAEQSEYPGVLNAEEPEEVRQEANRLGAAQELLQMADQRRGAARAIQEAASRDLEAYLQLGHTCDRCLQPITTEQARETADRLKKALEEATDKSEVADADAREAATAASQASSLLQEVRMRHVKAVQEASAAAALASAARNAARRSLEDARGWLGAASQLLNELSAAGVCLNGSPACEKNLDVLPLSSKFPPPFIDTVPCGRAHSAAANALRDLREASTRSSHCDYLQQEVSRRAARLEDARSIVETLKCRHAVLVKEVEDLCEVDEAFRPTGVVSYVLEGALGALQEETNYHLQALAPGFSLEMSLTSGEQVSRRVLVRPTSFPAGSAATGEAIPRAIRQLSGGERRRVALALALGFTEFASQRGRLRTDLLVLDEVMQHLDEDGCARVAALLRSLVGEGRHRSVLLVAQAGTLATRAVDAVDVVVRRGLALGSAVETVKDG